MTDDDKIMITRAQYREWLDSPNADGIFDSLKAHVSRPKRREDFYAVFDADGDFVQFALDDVIAWKILRSRNVPGDYVVHVREVLPGDIGPMTKDEAREWVTAAIKKYTWGVYSERGHVGDCIPEILKTLGLSSEEG